MVGAWVSPLSFECHTQSKGGPAAQAGGFSGGRCSLGCLTLCPGEWHQPRVGMQREQPEALYIAGNVVVFICTELVLLIFQ